MNRGQLGSVLRELRLASGRQANAVARSAVMSPSKLSKIENGRLTPSAADVELILSALGVTGDIRDRYLEVARTQATEALAWRLLKRSGVHKAQQELRSVEAQMTTLRLFQPALIPGLLQTPEYMRAILGRHGLSEDSLHRTTLARLERQGVLHDSGKTFSFVMTETVLRWLIVEADVMARQLERIISLSRLPQVDIRCVPLSARQRDIANHSFVIRDDRTVTVETIHAELTVTDPRDIDLYISRFEAFQHSALADDAMRSALSAIRLELLKGGSP